MIAKKYLCDYCRDDKQGEEQIYSCNECKRNLCISCLINLKVGALIPYDDNRNIDSKYCPFCGNEHDKTNSINIEESLEKTENNVGKKVEVCFNYNKKIVGIGTIVRDDTESPFVTIIKLTDGRYVLDFECQYRII